MKTLAVLALGLACGGAAAADIWGPDGFPGFCAGLRSLRSDQVPEFLRPVLNKRGLDPDSIHIAGFEDIDPVLERGVRLRLATLDAFTDPGMAQGSRCSVLLDRKTLTAIDAKYDLHSVWLIAGAEDERGRPRIHMNYLMAGNGLLALGYDGEMEVSVDDGSGDKHTYRYMPHILSEIVNSQSRRGLFNLQALSREASRFEGFFGPYGARIQSFEISGGAVRVSYDWVGEHQTTAAKFPIEIRPFKRGETDFGKKPL